MTTTVKYWSNNKSRTNSFSDYYWAEHNSSNDLLQPDDKDKEYKMNVIHSSPYTSCVRVAPHPYQSHFVTIASIPSHASNTIETQLWSNLSGKNTSWNDMNDTLNLQTILGKKYYDKGVLIGAELCVGTTLSSYGVLDSSDVELQLCCLSDTGYITIYVSLFFFHAPFV